MPGSITPKSIGKYLAHYCEKEVGALRDFPDGCFEHVVLIPVYRESEHFARRFISQFSDLKVLLILVINQPEDDDDILPQQSLWQQLSRNSDTRWQAKNLALQVFSESAVQVLMVDRFSVDLRIPKKQGVGLARKIAADIACVLIQQQCIKDSQIYSTDADARLPGDYFRLSQLPENASAGVFHFRHALCGDQMIDDATALYEQRLHYYVQGLRFAGSDYAFHTIGSCLCFTMQAYCQARGFPKKSGGEDFYLLNKLAKSGEIIELQALVDIRARISDRVPFGTGPAVASIVEKQLTENTYKVYHPEIFERLRKVLKSLNLLCHSDMGFETFLDSLDISSAAFFKEAQFEAQFIKWQKQFNQIQLQCAVHQWFDAFRTLKFVHYQQANGLRDTPLATAIKALSEKHNLLRGISSKLCD